MKQVSPGHDGELIGMPKDLLYFPGKHSDIRHLMTLSELLPLTNMVSVLDHLHTLQLYHSFSNQVLLVTMRINKYCIKIKQK